MTNDLQDANLSKLCTSLHDIALRDFIACACDNALHLLGEGTEEERQAAWEALLEQWNEQIADRAGGISEETIIEYMRLKIDRIKTLVWALSQNYHPAIAEALAEDGLEYPADGDEVAIRRLTNELRSDEIQLETLIREYKRRKGIKDESEGEQKEQKSGFDRDWFYSVLTQVSDMKKYEINEGITTYRFCLHYKDLVRYIENMNKRKNDGG